MVLVLYKKKWSASSLCAVYKDTVKEEKAVVKPFRLSRNTSNPNPSIQFSNSIYQGAVFKATRIIYIKKLIKRNSKVPQLVGGDDVSIFRRPHES